MQIVIPMAGHGSRFQAAGYDKPKFLTDVAGEPMICRVLANLPHSTRVICVVLEEHAHRYPLASILRRVHPYVEFLVLKHPTGGPAETVLATQVMLKAYEPLLIANSDQLLSWCPASFAEHVRECKSDGVIVTFTSTNPAHSYVLTAGNNHVLSVREKDVISDIATCGLYYFKQAKDFVYYADNARRAQKTNKGEYYVAPLYQDMIDDGKVVTTYHVERFHSLGTPEDLGKYLQHGGVELVQQVWKGGWFVGNFEPSAFRTTNCEVALKRHKQGELVDRHFHKRAAELNLLVEGSIHWRGRVLQPGDVLRVHPGGVVDWEYLTDCTLVVVKIPSVPGDKHEVRDSDLPAP